MVTKTVRWVAVPCMGIALFLWIAATFATLHSATSVASTEDFVTFTRSAQQAGADGAHPSWKEAAAEVKRKPVQVAQAQIAPQIAPKQPAQKPVTAKPVTARKSPAAKQQAVVAAVDPFAKAIEKAGLSHDKLLAAFADAGMTVSLDIAEPVAEVAEAVEMAMPSAARFHRDGKADKAPEAAAMASASILDPSAPLALGPIGIAVDLAYASAGADGSDVLEVALATLEISPPESDVAVALAEPEPEKPDAAPRDERQVAQRTDKPAERQAAVPLAQRERGSPLFRSPRSQPDTRNPAAAPARQEALAYARPDKPNNAFKNLFNDTPKAGNKVAIYDISAAVVYMPDGSKLEAHSGIGKMADNPRYVNVKMNGPTPPNTYRLSMREKRFHGVEAVRMTPIGDQTMHGRDGILAHSYLLRGGREESHGCVAFENYPRFLQAFKQGKVTHLIVVPSMSKLTKAHFAPIRGA